jgi:hypothetical protein
LQIVDSSSRLFQNNHSLGRKSVARHLFRSFRPLCQRERLLEKLAMVMHLFESYLHVVSDVLQRDVQINLHFNVVEKLIAPANTVMKIQAVIEAALPTEKDIKNAKITPYSE